MRNKSLYLLMWVMCGSFAHAANEPAWKLTEANGGPSLTAGDLLDGKVTVLVFWATWCPYCKALLPHIQSIADEYSDQVSIAALNFREDADPAAYFAERGYTLALYPDGDKIAASFGIRATPGVLVFDGGGEIVFNLYHYMPVAKQRLKAEGEKLANWQKAARLTPLWAAELRRKLDATLANP